MLRDARYSIRLLLRNPLVASVAVLSLALGIGGAASVFTVLSAIVLRDLPLPNPQQLYAAEKHRASDVSTRYSWPLVEQARQELQGRAEIFAATTSTQMQVRLARGTDGAERSNVQLVSGGFFDALRQRAQLGRLIEPGDTSAVSANPVMVISDAYWRRRFQADPAIIGRELIVGSASLTVIGVTAPGFFGPFLAFRNPDVWVPLTMQNEIRYAFNASTSDESDGTKPWAIQPGIEWLSLFARVPDVASANGVGSALTLLHQRDASTRLDGSSADGPHAARQGADCSDERRPRGVVFARRSVLAAVRASGDAGSAAWRSHAATWRASWSLEPARASVRLRSGSLSAQDGGASFVN